MNLSAGLAAADSFFQNQEHLQDRDYLAKQRAYQQAIMQAGLDTLPDKTRAEVARYGLDTDTSNAERQVLPGQTANALKRQGIESGTLDFQQRQQPIEQGIAAADTQFRADTQPQQQAVEKAGLDRAVADIPEQEAARVAGNVSKMTARHVQNLVDLSRYLTANDKAGALAHINAVAPSEPTLQGKKFVDIAPDVQGNQYVLTTEGGEKMALPFKAIQQAAAMAKTGKYSMHEGRDGSVKVLNENTGDLQVKVPANPDLVRTAGNNAHTPAQMQIAQAYMKDDPKLTFTQAMEKVKTASEKPTHQLILDMVAKDPGAINDPEGAYKKWAHIVQMAKSGSTMDPNPSNSGAGVKIDPKYQSLFTP